VTRYRMEHHCDGSAWYDVSYPSPVLRRIAVRCFTLRTLSKGRGKSRVFWGGARRPICSRRSKALRIR